MFQARTLPELLRTAAAADNKIYFSGFCAMLQIMSEKDRNLIASVIDTDESAEVAELIRKFGKGRSTRMARFSL